MITCNLRGGLGNQLFRIFATMSYAIDNNHIFCFKNTYALNNGVTQRHTYWHSLLIFLRKYLSDSNYIPNMKVVGEKTFSYEELPFITKLENVILDGYFQSPKYFEKNYKHIYDSLQFEVFKKTYESFNAIARDKKINKQNLTALTIRRRVSEGMSIEEALSAPKLRNYENIK